MARRAFGPSDVQPDPWEPTTATCERVEEFLGDVTAQILTPDGESFEECRLCGDVDSHTDDCPLPALRRWMEQGA